MIVSPLLSKIGGHIAGSWIEPQPGQSIKVINPANGDHLADVPNMAEGETTAAIESAATALKFTTTLDQRRTWMEAITNALLNNKDELARIITLEQGKPIKESVVEVDYAAGFFRYFGKMMSVLAPELIPETIRDCRWVVYRRPTGVTGLITPWNFPLGLLAKKLAPAIATGCGVVAKPALQTPLTAVALWNLLEHIDLPRGLLNLVIGQSAPIGDTLCTHPLVRLISFTGSTPVGKLLGAKAAPQIKRLAMELGGNAPFIVFDDADVDDAAAGLIPNKFRCAGQTCVCANRIYVHQKVSDRFLNLISSHVSRLCMGDGMAPSTDVGPLINRAGFEKVQRHVRDALEHGAVRRVGHDPEPPKNDWGCFYPPTVLANVQPNMLVAQEETFGPIVAVQTFDTEEGVIEAANSTPYGLAAYLYTQDKKRAERVTARLQFGHVGVNTGTGPTPEASFGGMKESGYGREGGPEGLFEFCETQAVPSR